MVYKIYRNGLRSSWKQSNFHCDPWSSSPTPWILKRGVVTLLPDYEVCKEGDVLTPEQAHVLKLFRYEMAEFKAAIKYLWDVQSRRF